MEDKIVLITGSLGLVGSECVKRFIELGYTVCGIDTDARINYFGEKYSNKNNKNKSLNYIHYDIDITNKKAINNLFRYYNFELIIHTAAQPSHEYSALTPIKDFEVNTLATLNLLENTKKYCPEAPFIFVSTNKVYGDLINKVVVPNYVECSYRYTVVETNEFYHGIDESMSIDQSLHSPFGVSKAAADLYVQEYGRYYGLKTVCFRAGCISGINQNGCKEHGFLSYLVHCLSNDIDYTIHGYKGKQVRDIISASDLVEAFVEFSKNPKTGEVYNIGGGFGNSVSLIEIITEYEEYTKTKVRDGLITFNDSPRKGDHKWWITDYSKFKSHYPNWFIRDNVLTIIRQLINKNRKEKYKNDLVQ